MVFSSIFFRELKKKGTQFRKDDLIPWDPVPWGQWKWCPHLACRPKTASRRCQNKRVIQWSNHSPWKHVDLKEDPPQSMVFHFWHPDSWSFRRSDTCVCASNQTDSGNQWISAEKKLTFHEFSRDKLGDSLCSQQSSTRFQLVSTFKNN